MSDMSDPQARIIVFSTLFPSPAQPAAGLFIRERMFRVGEHLPLRHLPFALVGPLPFSAFNDKN
jgi:hypothetical protein